jgi:hypothetical protein
MRSSKPSRRSKWRRSSKGIFASAMPRRTRDKSSSYLATLLFYHNGAAVPTERAAGAAPFAASPSNAWFGKRASRLEAFKRGRKPALWAFRRMRSPLLPAVPSVTPSPFRSKRVRSPARAASAWQPCGGTPKSGFRPVRLTRVF